MKNIGLIKFLDADVNSFTSDMGLKIRKIIAKPLKILLKIATPEKIHVIKYPQLKKNEPYIFVSNHGFINDIISALATILKESIRFRADNKRAVLEKIELL